MYMQSELRALEAHEFDAVAGGTDEIVVTATVPTQDLDPFLYNQLEAMRFDFASLGSFGGGCGGALGGPAGNPGEFVDTDGDGEEDTIVVTATDWQQEVMSAWQAWVNLHVNTGELLLGFVPMARVVEMTLDALLNNPTEQLQNELAASYYDMDALDGMIDGYVQPQLLNTLPQTQPGYWIGSAR
jgi:hypothetical protein